MKLVTKEDLKNRLSSVKGARPITITARTVPNMNKKGNPFFGRVWKISRVNGMINWQYQNSVNNQRLREDKPADFKSHPRSWGERIPNSPLVKNGSNLYLEMKVERELDSYFVDENYNELDKAEVLKFMRKHRESVLQDLSEQVVLRDYNLNSIEHAAFDGEELEVQS